MEAKIDLELSPGQNVIIMLVPNLYPSPLIPLIFPGYKVATELRVKFGDT